MSTPPPSTPTATRYDRAAIEADPTVPMIHIWRDFWATPEQLFRAHTDPALFARWVGPEGMGATILEWDATNNGKWRYFGGDSDDNPQYFRGSFHTVSPTRIVQTFTWEGMPDDVALETLRFENLGDGRTRLVVSSLCDSFEARDAWLRSDMETGVNDGYAKLDGLLAAGAV
jgi:uncharacterized protein YndB with AHSA1/START domain